MRNSAEVSYDGIEVWKFAEVSYNGIEIFSFFIILTNFGDFSFGDFSFDRFSLRRNLIAPLWCLLQYYKLFFLCFVNILKPEFWEILLC